jgi:ribosomal-protein-alanine N-acetyltransferase
MLIGPRVRSQIISPMPDSLTTPRLILRRWRPADRELFRSINADPRVMEFFPSTLTPAESDALADRIEAHFGAHGFGGFAAELRTNAAFIGYIGLAVPNFDAAFLVRHTAQADPPHPQVVGTSFVVPQVVEIGWRLAHSAWGHGFATEGARAVARYAFEALNLPSLVSFTVPANLRSRRVMEKIGMVHDPSADFLHPNLPQGHPLRPHVLYRL